MVHVNNMQKKQYVAHYLEKKLSDTYIYIDNMSNVHTIQYIANNHQ